MKLHPEVYDSAGRRSFSSTRCGAPSVQSGRAIQHVRENIFTAEGGVRRGIPNVLVVLTDGRSQDDVNKVSKELQMEGQRRVKRKGRNHDDDQLRRLKVCLFVCSVPPC